MLTTIPKQFTTEKTFFKKGITGSEAVVLSLLQEGVDVIFGYPGGAIMPIYDAMYDYRETLHHILVRHEQGASHAAQGYARVTGKVGVCLATSGPGATNLITGIADAQIDSTPIVCITGQVPSHLLGKDAFQETDVVGISMPVTKWNFQVTRTEEIPDAIAKAFYLAKTGRPGPVLIDITKDAQFGKIDFAYKKCTGVKSYFPYPQLDHTKITTTADLINNSQKPLILCGQGVLLSGAQEELIKLAEKAEIPVASTILGLSAFPTGHRLFGGMLGMHGNYAANIKTNQCDVLIAVGMRFDDRVTGDVKRYANQAKIIHIDIDKAEINKNIPVTVAIHADAKQALQILLPLVNTAEHKSWLKEFDECNRIEKEQVIQEDLFPKGEEIKMGEVIRLLNEKTKGEAIIVTDVGQHQMIACRYYRFTNPNSLVTSGGLGTMGFGLPAAIGAKTGSPDRTVICICGDGGFQMTIQELGTIFQSEIGVKILLLNNRFLGMVRQWQQLFFDKRYSQTEMINPDFIKIAEGYSIPAEKIKNRENLSFAIDKWLNTKGACLLEIEVEQEENVFPMVPAGASVSEVRLK